jgi:hypothetical protein
MMNVSRRHGKLGSGKQGRRTGCKQAGFMDHGSLLKFLTGPAGKLKPFQAGQVLLSLGASASQSQPSITEYTTLWFMW